MRYFFHQQNIIVKWRIVVAQVFVVLMIMGLTYRLWYVQVYRGPYYKKVSERNRIQRLVVPAQRGLIFDRNNKPILKNEINYDLIYIRQYVKDEDGTLKLLSRLLNEPYSYLEKRLKQGRGSAAYIPIVLKRSLTNYHRSKIEYYKPFIPGIDVARTTRRAYEPDTPTHMIGYLREVSLKTMKSFNKVNPDNPYIYGDLVGKNGLERKFEKYLRGHRGFKFLQVDAFGRESNYKDFDLPDIPAFPGSNLVLTIDWELQKAAVEAFRGKSGAVIAIDPRNGELLVFLSEPSIDPATMQSGITNEQWSRISTNSQVPLLDKTTGATYPPGSTYKSVLALAGLQEKVITPKTEFYCPGHYQIGKKKFRCWKKGGHGVVNLNKSLVQSCDVYYYHVGMRLGPDRIAKYARDLGLGKRANLGLNMEQPGLVPTTAWKMRRFKQAWQAGETPSISIGQGYNSMTPLQLAILYMVIANEGRIWQPTLVKKITNSSGTKQVLEEFQPKLMRATELIDPENFRIVKQALKDTVMKPGGTGWRARVQGQDVAGKTGTVQVVALSKYRKRHNVSMKWREHAMFASFSPVTDPEIVVIVVSQNDSVGGGGKSAAPVAGKILQSYWSLKEKRRTSNAVR